MSDRVALAEVAEINPPLRRSVRDRDLSVAVPFIPMAAVSEAGTVSFSERRPLGGLLQGFTSFERGDILLAKITPCFENGKAAHLTDLPDDIGFGSTEFHVIRPGPRVDPRYLFHAVWNPAFRRLGERQMTGTAGQRRLPSRTLKEWRLQLPPMPEQHRIAATFDIARSIQERRRASLGSAGALLHSAFLQAFGNPVTNDRNWSQFSLCEFASVERGKFTPRPRNDPRYYGGAYPFVQTGDIARSDGTLRQWQQTLNDAGANVSRLFPQGTIAIAIAANIGDTAIVNFDFYCPDSVVGIEADPARVDVGYLEYCLRFFKKRLQAGAPKTAQRNINLQAVRPLLIPLPPRELQVRFGSLRERMAQLRQRYNQELLELSNLRSSLSQDL